MSSKKSEKEEQLSHLQEQAEEVGAEAQEPEARPKERTFAKAESAEDADGLLPSLDELVLKWVGKTKEEILKKGTPLEKLRLYYCSSDLNGYFGDNGKLTREEINQVAEAVRGDRERVLWRKCNLEYSGLKQYGEKLSFYFKRFQATYATLAVLLNKWDGYEKTAKKLSDLFNFNSEDMSLSDFIFDHREPFLWQKDVDILYSPERVQKFLERTAKYITFEGATLKVDKQSLSFMVDIHGEGGLYSQILHEAGETVEDFEDFKAFADVAEEFYRDSTLKYLPLSIDLSIENAKQERYTRYLVKNLSFFRSDLNERKARGEAVTPEDKKKALIPDYYEVRHTKDIYKSCKNYLKSITRDEI